MNRIYVREVLDIRRDLFTSEELPYNVVTVSLGEYTLLDLPLTVYRPNMVQNYISTISLPESVVCQWFFGPTSRKSLHIFPSPYVRITVNRYLD